MLVQLIVECTSDKAREDMILSIGEIKYRLPMINSYVIELPEDSVKLLRGIKGIKAVHSNAHITAQMKMARKTINADIVHQGGYKGKGIGVAILDTGVAPVDDLIHPINRIIAFKDFVNNKLEPYDDNGHGTHVAGIVAGNGYRSRGEFCGVAPESNVIAIKILDSDGKGNSADVLAGLQWLVDNKNKYNIRVANLSIGTADVGSKDPLVKAVEKAWDLGIFITIAAGNNGPEARSVTSPGISRKVLTVGASDDNTIVSIDGNYIENFSGRGPTSECIVKPDVVAPGTDIVSCTPSQHTNKISLSQMNYYVKLSGTSMSTPMVSGAVAVLLQKRPHLKPDDVKLLFKKTCRTLQFNPNRQGWGLVDLERLLDEED